MLILFISKKQPKEHFLRLSNKHTTFNIFEIMDALAYYWDIIYTFLNKNPHIFILFVFISIISATSLCFFFFKSKQKPLHALIPIWNIVVFLKIVGRPWWHVFFFLIPIYNIIFGIQLIVELNRSYGKFSFLRNFFAVLFNGFYVMYLGFSGEQYKAPSYGKSKDDILKISS